MLWGYSPKTALYIGLAAWFITGIWVYLLHHLGNRFSNQHDQVPLEHIGTPSGEAPGMRVNTSNMLRPVSRAMRRKGRGSLDFGSTMAYWRGVFPCLLFRINMDSSCIHDDTCHIFWNSFLFAVVFTDWTSNSTPLTFNTECFFRTGDH
jgi:hypothetical protein